ncbi:MAG: extracellular solute-binding protein [Ruminococcus sp.]|nr:extracellular solute-binding protein [Ruminococcus sp.]
MRALKTALAFTIALTAAAAIAGCGGKKEEKYEQKVEVANTEDIADIPDGAQKELVWLSYFDLNPTKRTPEKRSDVALFEMKGGSIKYEQSSSLEVYSKLASDIMAATPPDIFWYETGMTFPANCVKEMFQPIDDAVDFDQPLWADVRGMAEQYTMNGRHYVAPINYQVMSVLTYDKDMIEAANLDDPYELYLQGEWDWDTWFDMMKTYVDAGTEGEERYGVNGWFAPFIFHSTGKTIVYYDEEAGEYAAHYDDPDLVRAANFLYELKKNGLYNAAWLGQASDCFKANTLFYAMGSWASIDTHTPKEGDNWGVVPIPKDPNSDTLYTTIDVNSYMWVKGSTKTEAYSTWMQCARIVNVDPEYIATEKAKFDANNPYWTDEMYQVAYSDLISDKYVQIFDPGYGISTTLSDNGAATNDTKEALIPYMYTSVMKEDENGTQFTWTSLCETYRPVIQSELDEFNKAYREYLANNP